MGNLVLFWKMFHMITGGHFQCHDHRPKEGTNSSKNIKVLGCPAGSDRN